MIKIIFSFLVLLPFCLNAQAQKIEWQDYKLADHYFTDDLNKVTEESIYLPNGTLSKLSKNITIKSEAEQQNTRIRQVWDKQEQNWINKSKYVKISEQGVTMFFKWSESSDDWEKKRKNTKFDDYTKVQWWGGDNYKEGYQRSVKESNTTTVQVTNSTIPESWKNHSRVMITFENGRKETIKQRWNNKKQNWKNTIKCIESKTNDRETRVERYTWDKDLNIWNKHQLKIHSFDKDGIKLKTIIHTWNDTSNLWEKKYRNLFIRDENSLVQVIKQKWVEISMTLAIEEKDKEQEKLCDCVFPNPYSIGEIISCHKFLENSDADIYIFDLYGKEVFKTPYFETDISIQLNENLISGIYFLVIQEDNNVLLKEKLIIQD